MGHVRIYLYTSSDILSENKPLTLAIESWFTDTYLDTESRSTFGFAIFCFSVHFEPIGI
jgi:hypothetical protein